MYIVEVLAIFTMKIIKIHSENGRSVKVSFRKIWGIFGQHNRLSLRILVDRVVWCLVPYVVWRRG